MTWDEVSEWAHCRKGLVQILDLWCHRGCSTPPSHPNSNPCIMVIASDASRTPNPIRIADDTTKETVTLPAGELGIHGFITDLNPFLFLVHITRQQLIDHQHFRAPYLKCFDDLYDGDDPPLYGGPRARNIIRFTRPTRPTDSDIRDFFIYHWPGVLLERTSSRLSRSFRCFPRVQPVDDPILMSHDLAVHLIERVISPVSGQAYILTLFDARKHLRKRKEYLCMSYGWLSYRFFYTKLAAFYFFGGTSLGMRASWTFHAKNRL